MCNCKVGRIPATKLKALDEQLKDGTPLSVILNWLQEPTIEKQDLSYHRVHCFPKAEMISSVAISTETLDSSKFRDIGALKAVLAARIAYLTAKNNLSPLENNQLTAAIDLQRKLIESPAKEREATQVDPVAMGKIVFQGIMEAKANGGFSKREIEWTRAHLRRSIEYRGGDVLERVMQPNEEGYWDAPPNRPCGNPKCSICVPISSKSDTAQNP